MNRTTFGLLIPIYFVLACVALPVFAQAPALTSVSPTAGTPLGGTSVTLTGTDFTAADSVTFGGTAAASVTFNSATSLTAVTPAGTPGAVDVVVSNVNGSSTLPGGFTYNSPPALTSISPTSGTPLGGTSVTLTGTDFSPSDSVTFGGAAATTVTFISSTTLSAVTPTGVPGAVDVVVSNGNGSSTLAGGFTYNTPPTLTSISPTNGPPAGGTSVTLTGTDFTASDSVTFGGVAAASVTFVSATSLNAVTPAGSAGTADVVVSNANGSSTLAAGFTYNAPPSLSSVTPANGTPLGGDTVTLTGTNFTATTSATFDGLPAVTTFVNSTTLTAVTPAHPPDIVNVAVSNENGSSTVVGAFTYDNPPAITILTPGNGTPLGGDTITITGTDFTADAAVTFDGLAAATTFVNATTLEAVTPAHAPGAVDVTVTNLNGADTLVAGFLYDTPPTLTSVNPTNGSPLGGTTVTLTGTAFTAGTSVTFDGLAATGVTFISSTSITADTPAHAPGTIDVAVSNANGSSTLVGAFTYDNAPSVTSVAPANGTPLGGDSVTITGTGFTADATVTFDGLAATAVTFVSATSLTATTPAHPSGAVDVVVTNLNGSGTLAGGFTYDNAPSITAVNPANGSPLGGDAITISGADFTADATVTIDGSAATSVTFVDSMTLTAVTPAHAPGAVDVTVTNLNGSGTLSSGFTYDAPPTLTSLAPANGSPLGTTVVTLTGTGFNALTTVSFDGIAATSVTFIDALTLEAVAPAHAPGVVDVTVTNANGTDTLVGSFTYDSAPTVTSIAPATGSPLGGTAVTVTGTDFTADAVVSIGGTNATSTTFVNTTTLNAVTPAGTPGTADVVVTNANGSATLAGGFGYDSPPTVSSVAPNNGTPLGGTLVTITGSNFTGDAIVTFDGVAAPSMTFVSTTSITATTPAGTAGPADVTVTNLNGSGTAAGAFTYNNPPTVTSLTPAVGSTSGGFMITLNGSNLTPGTVVTFGGVASPNVMFIASIALNVEVPANVAGVVDVVVSNLNGDSTLVGGFTYLNPPTLTSVAPSNGSPLGGETITLTGTDFTADSTATIDGVNAPLTFVSSTSVTLVTPAHAPGTVDVSLSNSVGTSTLPASFTYDTPPVLVSISPTSGLPTGGDLVTFTGTDFTPTTTATFDGVAATSVTFIDSTTLTALTPAHLPDTVNVAVSNVNGSSTLAGAYLYLPTDPPTITGVTPNSGTPAGGNTVMVTGTNFTPTTTVTFGGTAATSVTFESLVSLTVVTPANASGSVNVVVSNVNGTDTLSAGFTYDNPPTISGVAPSTGSPVGGELVVISGADFSPATTVSFGGVNSPSVTFVSATTLNAVTPMGASGMTVDVSVSNPSGSDTLVGGFSYNQSPMVTEILPVSGSPAGGDTVSITGTDFTADVNVLFGGIPSPGVTFVSSTNVLAITPAQAAGFVDVTVSNADGSGTLASAFLYLPPNVMELTSVTAQPGGIATTRVMLTNENSISGYTTVLTFDNTIFTLNSVEVTGLDVIALVGPVAAPGDNGGIEFFATDIDNAAGIGSGTCIFDINFPFDQQQLSPGTQRSIMRFEFGIVNDPLLLNTTEQISLTNNVGSPPLSNTISESGISVFPALLPANVSFVNLPLFVRGDANGDGLINIADGVFILQFLFSSGAAPNCLAAANVNGDSTIDISDIINLISFQFQGGFPPMAPFPDCGIDANEPFDCVFYPGC